MSRHIAQAELQNACRRIDPNTDDLSGKAKGLMDQGPYLTLAMALVQIADEQNYFGRPTPGKPPGSAAPLETSQSQSA
jgi:hypothetical protein